MWPLSRLSQREFWVDGELIEIENVSDGSEMEDGKRLQLDYRFIGRSRLRSILSRVPTTLTVLNIGGCGLASIPESISRLTNLQRLRVEDNNLKEFPRSMGSLTQLTRLRAYGNELSWLPKEFRSLCNLKILRLGGNEFGTYTNDGLGVIRNMRALEKLFLKDNPNLTEIPDYIARENLRIYGVDDIYMRKTKSFAKRFRRR